MSSRRIDSITGAAEAIWRPFAERAGYDVQLTAQLLGVSVRQFERRCQRELGCTPSEWIDRQRMDAAVRLLVDGQPVKVVALRLGYSQASNFSRDFKRHFGSSPTVFFPRQPCGTSFRSPDLRLARAGR